MNSKHDPSKSWNKNIINNLRFRYKLNEGVQRATDTQLLKAYDEFSDSNSEGQDGEDNDFCDYLHDFLVQEG